MMQVSYFKHAKRHSFHVMFFEDQYVPVQRNIYIYIMILYSFGSDVRSRSFSQQSNGYGPGQNRDPKN